MILINRLKHNYLIMFYNKKYNNWEDISSDVSFLSDDGYNYKVFFINSQKYYVISKANLRVYPLLESYVNKKYELITINKKIYNNVEKIYYYGNCYKVYFKNDTTIITKDIKIVNNKKNNMMQYYKELSSYAASLKNDNNSVEEILNKLYVKYADVLISRTDNVLDHYLNGYAEKKEDLNPFLIFPFSTNLSQITATKNAFCSDISVIQGPPGTGKTQTILNIVANAVIRNEKVAIISNNNEAIKNVYDKLAVNNLNYFVANLGNTTNVTNFFNMELDTNYKKQVSKLDYDENYKRFESEILKKLTSAKLYLELENKIIEEKSKLYNLIIEQAHYNERIDINKFTKYKINRKVKYLDYLKIKNKILKLQNNKIFGKLLIKLLLIKSGICSKKILIDNDFFEYLEYLYYEEKVKYLKESINTLEKKVETMDKTSLEDVVKLSRLYFDSFLYENKFDYKNFNNNCYKKEFIDFCKQYPVILSTTHSLLRNIPNDFLFDMLIIDEASQANIMSTLLTFGITKKVIIVGDLKQLSQIDNKSLSQRANILAEKYKIKECYRYDNSILKSVVDSVLDVPTTVLREHYRCERRIIEFCNRRFYNNNLIIMTTNSEKPSINIIVTVPGNHARRNPNGSGQYNDREKDEIEKILEKYHDDVGIITPFRFQAINLKNKFKDKYSNVEIDTVHKFQGREKKIIILSTVVNDLNSIDNDNKVTDFINNPALLNVAVSRAKEKLYLIVSTGVYNSINNNIKSLIEYTKYYFNDSIEHGTIISIFDNLYKDNYKMLQTEMKKIKRVSKFDSENLLNNLIEQIIKDNKFVDLKIARFVRLKTLINNYDGFNKNEFDYITNYRTHVDFIIFSRISNKPLIAIELDGIKYHEQNSSQLEKDDIKTRILRQNGINVIRLKTNGSQEKEILTTSFKMVSLC